MVTSESPAKLVVPFATDVNGNEISLDLGKSESILISYPLWMTIDPTIIKHILDELIVSNSPDELKLIITDLCITGLKQYGETKHLLTPVIDTFERTLAAHQWSLKEIQKRIKILEEHGVKTIEEYNQVAGFTAMEYVLVVTVDISEIIITAPSVIYNMMINIFENARRVGFIFVATTKHPRDKMSELFKTKIAYKGDDEVGIVNYKACEDNEFQQVKLLSR